MSKEIFAERLRTSMAQQGKKQVDLIRAASEQGVKLGKSHISQYVSGKTLPRPDILHFLADTLQVDADWLRGDEPADAQAASGDSGNSIHTIHRNNTVMGDRKMRTFKKSSKLDNVLYDVRGPVVDEAARMEESGTQILKLNIGNPAPFGFRTPDEVIFLREKSNHAVCTAERNSEHRHRGHLHRKRRQRADQYLYVGTSGRRG